MIELSEKCTLRRVICIAENVELKMKKEPDFVSHVENRWKWKTL